MVHFKLRINKFYTFTASALIQVVGSPVYTFSIYATALGKALGLNHDQVAGIGTSLNFGMFLSLMAGAVYDQLEHHNRMGPRIAIWIGAALAAIGYSGLWLAASGRVAVGYAGVLVLAFIAGNASNWFDTAAIVTNVRNFPNNRGTIVGLLKSFVGLAGSLYSSVYACRFAPDAAAYLGLLAVTCSLLPLLLSLGVNHVPYVEAAEVHTFDGRLNPETRFLLAYVTVIVLTLYQMTSALLGAMSELPLPGAEGLDLLDINMLGMFCILALILAVPWNSGGLASRYVHEHLADPEEGPSNLPRWWQLLRLVDDNEQQLHQNSPQHQHNVNAVIAQHKLSMTALDSPSSSAAVDTSSNCASAPIFASAIGAGALHEPLLLRHQRQQHQVMKVGMGGGLQLEGGGDAHCAMLIQGTESGASPSLCSVECHHHFTNISLTQAVRTLQFWLLFFIFVANEGSCLTFLNNLSQINIALGGAVGGQVAFVSTYSVGNAAGRLLLGQGSESFLHSYGTPRTKWLLVVTAVLTGAVLSAAAATTPGHLYIVSPALGFCYGGIFTLIPSIAADLFGLRHFAANYAGLHTACVIGSYVMPTMLAGVFYDKAVAEHGTGQPCIGRDCYAPTFVVESVVCLLATACAGLVLATTKEVYKQLAQHIHEVEEEEQHDMMEQWQEEHQKSLVQRTLSDPNLSATTGLPAGLLGSTGGLHSIKTAPVFHGCRNANHQQATHYLAEQHAEDHYFKLPVHMTSPASAPMGCLTSE